MDKKQKNLAPGSLDRGEATHKKNHLIHCSKTISPKQKKLLKILLDHPTGVLSNRLREMVKSMNVHHLIRKLRLASLTIHCEMEPYQNEFDEAGTIGRIRLDPGSRKLAKCMLGAGNDF